MQQDSTTFKNSKTAKILFLASFFCPTFFCLGRVIDVYRFILVGAIFEMLWLPALAGIFVAPILSIILWVKEKFSVRSLNIYSILISACIILWIFLHK